MAMTVQVKARSSRFVMAQCTPLHAHHSTACIRRISSHQEAVVVWVRVRREAIISQAQPKVKSRIVELYTTVWETEEIFLGILRVWLSSSSFYVGTISSQASSHLVRLIWARHLGNEVASMTELFNLSFFQLLLRCVQPRRPLVGSRD